MTYVIISTQIWTDNWVSKHWIAHWLAEQGHDVYFVEPLRALLPKRGGRFRDLLLGPKRRFEGKVQVISLTSLPFYFRVPGFIRPLWRWAMRLQIRNLCDSLSNRPFDLITFDGRSLPLVLMLPRARRSAYYCVDPVGAGEEKRYTERDLVHHVDRVIAISESCKTALTQETGRPDVDIVPHGIDFKGVQQQELREEGRPHDLPKSANIIGYTGSIHDLYVDFEKINIAARNNPNWTFVFVGPYKGSDIAKDSSNRIRIIMNLPNVHLLGNKPYFDLRKYIAKFDVCLIPYRGDLENGWAKRSPVKILHYLSAGKAIVCADVPGVSAYGDLIYKYSNLDEFMEGIRSALKEKSDGEIKMRRKRMAASRDCDLVLKHLVSVLEKPSE